MTEFKLNNGQAIKLTKDGILIKDNHIEIDGNVIIVKDDKHASIAEHNDKGFELSVVNIDSEDLYVSKEGAITFQPNPIYYGKLVALEAKLSTAITEIDKLKTTIKLERALTDNKITDAVIKARLGE
ncbi:hypothetical protein [Leuconostoc falkenbergense]|uniref:hypothetical protein n=1 Tax=Leuconostoc falkenbergense TaxID=2766470 RepID=UPI00293CE6FE|nr:hypothetical protein [Leuconostoc falkenbergense]MDV3544876.1 hypothetical protein [Leuconostoc falkenbergense]